MVKTFHCVSKRENALNKRNFTVVKKNRNITLNTRYLYLKMKTFSKVKP